MAGRKKKKPVKKSPPRDEAQAQLFLNRELSWLQFNERVLQEACNPDVPMTERLKFQSIVSSNLDEFFMVRVAGLKQQISGEVVEAGPDGMTPAEQLSAISKVIHGHVKTQYENWSKVIEPALAEAGVRLRRPSELLPDQKAAAKTHFEEQVWPVLTPLAVDQGHPFPALKNRSLNLVILLHKEKEKVARRRTIVAVVQVPAVLSRLVHIPSTGVTGSEYVLLEDVIAMRVGDLFPGFRVQSCSPFRVTRNFDLSIDEDEADDILKTIQKELLKRERGHVVRLSISDSAPPEVISFLENALRLEKDDIYLVKGPLNLADLMHLYGQEGLQAMRDEPFSPQIVAPLQEYDDIFSVIRAGDVLLHHPYESFEHVIDFISEAADDPNVLAIKQTLYRTSSGSPVVRALTRAAENGKQVTAVVELKARFDEDSNIEWAKTLEAAGVHVVYGLVGLKTHCKMCLVVRREGGAIRRYVHLGTGNYNPSTARLYGDISLLTANPDFADDAGALFNLITGYSSPPRWKQFAVAPLGLEERIVELIDREAGFGKKGRIVAKMNSLVGANVIRALYRASKAGAKIDLIVRGICCLRPGVPGISDNIRVVSIVDRFLEHARIFYFENCGQREVFLASADWMPRNFIRRVEVMFPVLDPALRDRVVDEILSLQLRDNVKARVLQGDGRYRLVKAPGGVAPLRSQTEFMDLSRHKAYDPDSDKKAPHLRPRVPLDKGEDESGAKSGS